MLPLYGGKIWIKGDNGEKLCIPYAGNQDHDGWIASYPLTDGQELHTTRERHSTPCLVTSTSS